MTGGTDRWLEARRCKNVDIPDLMHLIRAPPPVKPGLPKMDFEELVNTRRSVRGFRAEPVPRSVIEEIIEVAKRAPSSMNTQPWSRSAGATWKRCSPAPSQSEILYRTENIRAFIANGR